MLLKLSTNTSITSANSPKIRGWPALYSNAASTPAGTNTKSDSTYAGLSMPRTSRRSNKKKRVITPVFTSWATMAIATSGHRSATPTRSRGYCPPAAEYAAPAASNIRTVIAALCRARNAANVVEPWLYARLNSGQMNDAVAQIAAATAASNTSSKQICGTRSIEMRPMRVRKPNWNTNRQATTASAMAHTGGKTEVRLSSTMSHAPAPAASTAEYQASAR
jgi:hypothetical protein